RFNFGGVGRSGGSYSGGREEVRDVAVALRAVADAVPTGSPLLLPGYSFRARAGALAPRRLRAPHRVVAAAARRARSVWGFAATMRAPLVVVVGDRDQYCPRGRLDALVESCGGRASVTIVAGADHFLAGREGDVAAAVRAAL